MFEKEAEDSFMSKKVLYKWETDKHSYIDGFKDGAEFGYNKANEWHYLQDNPSDLPDNGRRVLVKDKSRREYDVACLCRSKGNCDFWSYERFISRVSDNYIIAWCELPKFEE